MDLSSTGSLSSLAQTEIPVSWNVPLRHGKAFLEACSDMPRNTCSPKAGLRPLSQKPQLGVPHPLLLQSSVRVLTSMPRGLFPGTSRLTISAVQSHTGFPTEVEDASLPNSGPHFSELQSCSAWAQSPQIFSWGRFSLGLTHLYIGAQTQQGANTIMAVMLLNALVSKEDKSETPNFGS